MKKMKSKTVKRKYNRKRKTNYNHKRKTKKKNKRKKMKKNIRGGMEAQPKMPSAPQPEMPSAPLVASAPAHYKTPQEETEGEKIFVRTEEELKKLISQLEHGLVTVDILCQHGEFRNTFNFKDQLEEQGGISDLIIVNLVPIGGIGVSVGEVDDILGKGFFYNDKSLLLYEAYSEGEDVYLTDEEGCFTSSGLKFRNNYLKHRQKFSRAPVDQMLSTLEGQRKYFAISEKREFTEFNDNWFNDAATDLEEMYVSICGVLKSATDAPDSPDAPAPTPPPAPAAASDSILNIILVPFSLLPDLSKVPHPKDKKLGYLFSNIILVINKLLNQTGFEGKKVFSHSACRVFNSHHTPEMRDKANELENKNGLNINLYCFLRGFTDKFELFKKYNIINWNLFKRLTEFINEWCQREHPELSISRLLSDETRRTYIEDLLRLLESGEIERLLKSKIGVFKNPGGIPPDIKILLLLNDLFKLLKDWDIRYYQSFSNLNDLFKLLKDIRYYHDPLRPKGEQENLWGVYLTRTGLPGKSFYLTEDEITRILYSLKMIPEGWELKFNSDGKIGRRIYFQDNYAKTTQYEIPRILPTGWERKVTHDGRIYYQDHNTRTTQWDPP